MIGDHNRFKSLKRILNYQNNGAGFHLPRSLLLYQGKMFGNKFCITSSFIQSLIKTEKFTEKVRLHGKES